MKKRLLPQIITIVLTGALVLCSLTACQSEKGSDESGVDTATASSDLSVDLASRQAKTELTESKIDTSTGSSKAVSAVSSQPVKKETEESKVSTGSSTQSKADPQNTEISFKTAFIGHDLVGRLYGEKSLKEFEAQIKKYEIATSEQRTNEIPDLFKIVNTPEEQAVLKEDFQFYSKLSETIAGYDSAFFKENALVFAVRESSPFPYSFVKSMEKKDGKLLIHVDFNHKVTFQSVIDYTLVLLEVKKDQVQDVNGFTMDFT